MSSVLDEHQQWEDVEGKPFASGKVYIGTVDQDPVANQKDIFSDPELTVAVANPQTLDSFGRVVNKIYLDGKYSIEVQDFNDVQVYINLKNGVDSSAVASVIISNIAGTNTVTGTGSPLVASYVDKQSYLWKALNDSTGNLTVNWDGVGAISVRNNLDQQIVPGQVKANEIYEVIYNSTSNVMQLINPNRKVRYGTKGSDIASAATVDLLDLTGNSAVVTGSTGPITSFGTTPAGTIFYLTFTGTPIITYNATSLKIPGQTDILIAVGDQVRVESLGGGNNQIQVSRVLGRYRGALGKITAVVNTTSGLPTAVLFNAEGYDTDNIHDNVTNNSRMTVPAGVTQVRLVANLQYGGSANGFRSLEIKKNGALLRECPQSVVLSADALAATQLNVTSPKLDVVAGDYFESFVNQSSGGLLGMQPDHTWLEMEIIQ